MEKETVSLLSVSYFFNIIRYYSILISKYISITLDDVSQILVTDIIHFAFVIDKEESKHIVDTLHTNDDSCTTAFALSLRLDVEPYLTDAVKQFHALLWLVSQRVRFLR